MNEQDWKRINEDVANMEQAMSGDALALRGDLLKAAQQPAGLTNQLLAERDSLRAEIVRLTEDLADCSQSFDNTLAAKIADDEYYEAEIVRLREQLDDARQALRHLNCRYGEYTCIGKLKDNNLDHAMCAICTAKERGGAL